MPDHTKNLLVAKDGRQFTDRETFIEYSARLYDYMEDYDIGQKRYFANFTLPGVIGCTTGKVYVFHTKTELYRVCYYLYFRHFFGTADYEPLPRSDMLLLGKSLPQIKLMDKYWRESDEEARAYFICPYQGALVARDFYDVTEGWFRNGDTYLNLSDYVRGENKFIASLKKEREKEEARRAKASRH